MRTFKVTLAYDGTEFSGFQRQANARSVQGELEAALAPIEGGKVTVAGAGRTDAGVHALGQVASFRLQSSITESALLQALNATLPEDVRVLAVEQAADGFHARFSARSKVYRYRISNTRVLSPFERRYALHISRQLDLDAMQAAAREILGEHDFSCFQAKKTGRAGDEDDRTRVITRSEWTEHPLEDGDRLLVYETAGTGFLKYMVRNVIGTLIVVGDGRRAPESIRELMAAGHRGAAGPTAPPAGLYLVRVDYDTAAPVSFL
jgi:tRNA pseudouridine38-40 synthase